MKQAAEIRVIFIKIYTYISTAKIEIKIATFINKTSLPVLHENCLVWQYIYRKVEVKLRSSCKYLKVKK